MIDKRKRKAELAEQRARADALNAEQRRAVEGKILERLTGGPLSGSFLSGIVCGGLDLAEILGALEARGQIRKLPLTLTEKPAGWRRTTWRIA